MDKTVSAAEVRSMPAGTEIKIHYDNGPLNWERGKLAVFDRIKVLRIEDRMNGIRFRVIKDIPGSHYTVEVKAYG